MQWNSSFALIVLCVHLQLCRQADFKSLCILCFIFLRFTVTPNLKPVCIKFKSGPKTVVSLYFAVTRTQGTNINAGPEWYSPSCDCPAEMRQWFFIIKTMQHRSSTQLISLLPQCFLLHSPAVFKCRHLVLTHSVCMYSATVYLHHFYTVYTAEVFSGDHWPLSLSFCSSSVFRCFSSSILRLFLLHRSSKECTSGPVITSISWHKDLLNTETKQWYSYGHHHIFWPVQEYHRTNLLTTETNLNRVVTYLLHCVAV